MAPRKRKKQIDEGPFLFSEEEMLGMIENVTIIQATEPPKETKTSDNAEKPETKVEPSASLGEITDYELAAWCYCTFMESFPSMKDKLHLPYAMHYEKAKELLNIR